MTKDKARALAWLEDLDRQAGKNRERWEEKRRKLDAEGRSWVQKFKIQLTKTK